MSLVAAVVIVAVCLTLWNAPFIGQWRDGRPPADLLMRTTGLRGDWAMSADHRATVPDMWGVEERWKRVWSHSESGVSETVHRLSSPTWAFLMFRMAGPAKRVGEYYDSMKTSTPAKGPSTADEVRYHCARRYTDSEKCDEWYVWMRYGQYLVEINADAPPSGASAGPQVPDWLCGLVGRADTALNDAAPRG